MQTLIEKLRKARQQRVEVDGKTFIVRRPTDLEIVHMTIEGKTRQSDILSQFVVGWQGVTELDIIPGGTGEDVDFTPGLFMEWVADQPHLWTPICDKVTSTYEQHTGKKEVVEKKPETG